ncbi:MAG TPA: beta-ketoacyl-ACP synthase III [Nitrospirota bacterium]|jgi:3-oxoacyl-[acyl-carrier-protein] synthase-3
MIRTKILGTGSYAPDKVLTNHDIEKMVDTSDEWIQLRTGIRERRIAPEDWATSDLAYRAGKNALEMAGVEASELDLIIVATVTPDSSFPSTACILQEKLGATRAAGFDMAAACSGFIFALSQADAYIKSGIYKRILVIGAETLSKITDWTDRNTCVLFGDGAGAVVLGPSDDESGILSTHLHTDGSMGYLLELPAGGSRIPASPASVAEGQHYIKMRGNETFKVAVRALEEVVLESIEHNGMEAGDIDLLVPHQANLRIIQATAKRLDMPMEKVVLTVQKYGNTSAASVPMALDEAVRDGRIKKGMNILLEAFGGGLSWASAMIKW